MMRTVISNIVTFSLVSILLTGVISCKKSSDFSPAPTIAERPNYYFNPDSSIADTVKIEGNYFPIGYNLVAYIKINAPGKIKQIDMQTFGNFEKIKVENLKGDSIPLYKEPFWPNYSFKGPYDSETSQKYRIIITRATSKTTLAFIVTDQNNLQTPIYFYYQPVLLDKSLSTTTTLFSPTATAQDASGSDNLKPYFSNNQNATFSKAIAQSNPTNIDFAYAASADGNGYLTEADKISRFTQNTTDNLDPSRVIKTLFAPTNLDINTTGSNELLANIPAVMTDSIKVEAGKTYYFKNKLGNYGLIKIVSVQSGNVSNINNAQLNYNYIVTKPIN